MLFGSEMARPIDVTPVIEICLNQSLFCRNSGPFTGRKYNFEFYGKISISHERLHIRIYVRILAMASMGEAYWLDGIKWHQPAFGVCGTGGYLGTSVYESKFSLYTLNFDLYNSNCVTAISSDFDLIVISGRKYLQCEIRLIELIIKLWDQK